MIRATYFLVISLLLLTACNKVEVEVEKEAKPVQNAVAVLQPLNGSNVKGIVYFNMQGDVMEITADVTGLTPGNHGFHIHEYGDLRVNNGKLYVGGHFNPTNSKHGSLTSIERHAGDLGNILASQSGTAYYKQDVAGLTLSGENTNSILGRSIVIHAGEDDLHSQPSGNSGEKIAAGVIGIANKE